MTLKCEYCGGYKPAALAEFGITMKAQPSTVTTSEAAREAAREIAEMLLIRPEFITKWTATFASIISKRLPAAGESPKRYHCSCGAACTADEYIVHYFELGHDRGDGARSNAGEVERQVWHRDGVAHDVRVTQERYERLRAELSTARAEIESLHKGMKIRDTFISGDEAATGLSEIARFLDPHFTGREGRAMTWREIIEHVSDINRDKEEAREALSTARANAIREAVTPRLLQLVTSLDYAAWKGFNQADSEFEKGYKHAMKVAADNVRAEIAALLDKKEGEDGPSS